MRSRFAPSPTGLLHLGHAYSAWFAREHGDQFLLRIEDIDPTRCRPEFTDAIYEDLAWLGFTWETPARVQSEHLDDYRAALGRLQELGTVYRCFCTRRDIAEAASAAHGTPATGYPGTCRDLPAEDSERRAEAGAPFAWRLDVVMATGLTGSLSWSDRATGVHPVALTASDDFVVARRETPTSYHLSVVVDDALQGVTLVTRGIDLAESTPHQRLLQALLGCPEPEYWHHRLLLGRDGQRLAKRDKSVTLRALRESRFGDDLARIARPGAWDADLERALLEIG
ncbi:MAG: tRNA glutamyl-Q(34) synthetase GluQRS [Fimbriimonadaceae bacterium]|nr:tRNA glutamyl-Q(34) synthetase GluQRS [Fimbriimonadaceae bacterium]QYK56103.1 MAG: tRNA glutamyl-Q(34) synthetase GluQRS [Fimbriimonadaceae bacterium]